MIKALRITSIIVAIAAVVLFILPAVYGVRTDPQIEEFLKTPDAVEKFTAKGRSGAPGTRDESQGTPLVKQAADFARYLNPPPPPPPPPVQAPGAVAAQPAPAPMGPVSAKFNLIATSFYASNPGMSLALIDEPGKGLHWVKQGGTVEHLTIEKITDGTITIREGQRSSEMTVKSKELWRNLLKNPPPETRPGQSSEVRMPDTPESPAVSPGGGSVTPARPETLPGAARTRSRPGARAQSSQPRPGQTPPGVNPGPAGSVVAGKVVPASPDSDLASRGGPVLPSPAQPAQQDAASQSASPTQGTPASTSPAESGPSANDKQARLEKLMAELSSSKVTDDEAGQMEKLALELKKMQESEPSTGSAQQQPEASSQSAIQTAGKPDANSPEPNTPPDAN